MTRIRTLPFDSYVLEKKVELVLSEYSDAFTKYDLALLMQQIHSKSNVQDIEN